MIALIRQLHIIETSLPKPITDSVNILDIKADNGRSPQHTRFLCGNILVTVFFPPGNEGTNLAALAGQKSVVISRNLVSAHGAHLVQVLVI